MMYFFFNSFAQKSGKGGKSANIEAEGRQNDLFRILALMTKILTHFGKVWIFIIKFRLQQKFRFTSVLKFI